MRAFDLNAMAPAERPSTEALCRGWSAERRALSFFYEQLLKTRTAPADDRGFLLSGGFLGEGFKIRPTSPASFTLEVTVGLGFFYDPTVPLVVATDGVVGAYQGVSDVSPLRPLVLDTSVVVEVPAPPGIGESRYDIIEVRPKRALAEQGPGLRYNDGAMAFRPGSAAAFLRYCITQDEVGQVISPALSTQPLSYVRGVAAPTGTQVEPAGTPGYIRLARVLVTNGDTSIAAGRIADWRALLGNLEADGVVELTLPGGVPTMTDLLSPPGVGIFATQNGVVNPGDFSLILLTGGPVGNFSMTAQPINGFNTNSPTVVTGFDYTKNGMIDGTMATALANASLTAPASLVAVGQYYQRVKFRGAQWNAGTQLFDTASLANPARYSFHIGWSY